ncbi:MAG TPA: hypothetical protein VEL76_31015 [Gemmataceae bacterium]|nr:hypothetical protein [Gemmataceae bacterium]
MTMDLSGPQGEEHFNNTSWQMLLDLALSNGWKPAGVVRRERTEEELDEDEEETDEMEDEESEEEDEATDEADDEDAPLPEETAQALAALLRSSFPSDPVLGMYFCNDGNHVTAEDAAALADALERALPDLPEHDALGHKSFEHPSEPGVRLIRSDTPVNPFEWFSGKNKKRVEEFIAYCRKGGFEIW